MSIDHQATLDKGLKMKIKRTKPGTKTSEAKHEIVKATQEAAAQQLQQQQQQQQQQNGTLSGNNSNIDDPMIGNTTATIGGGVGANPSPSSSSHSSTSPSGSTLSMAGGGVGVGSNSNATNAASSKKHMSNSSSSSSTSSTSSASSSSSSSNSSQNQSNSHSGSGSQNTQGGNKRGSSGHRRDKTKEKSTHSSSRLSTEKSSSSSGNSSSANNSDKEQSGSDKIACQCNGNETISTPCAQHGCVRGRQDNTLAQRMGGSGTTGVPPGVFTPSAGSPAAVANAASAASLLAAATNVSGVAASTINTVTVSTNSNVTNATGLSSAVQATTTTTSTSATNTNKDQTVSGTNIKISSHIAAQLAAAAASGGNSYTNNSNNSTITTTTTSSSSTITTTTTNSNNNNLDNNKKHMAPGLISATMHHTISMPASNATNTNTQGDECSKSPPAKRAKHSSLVTSTELSNSNNATLNNKEMVDICIGTSVGTITEPDCLGPCEPGTSVTLEGIVWHETEGGVLVVNVTWRGKTYVGTLLDCTRHDWAPPRFCDSPTEELDSRTPKGRGKRGRSAALTPDLSNFTETRSSIYFSHAQVHSKLRNGAAKGGRGSTRTSSGANGANNSNNNLNSSNTASSTSSSGNGGGGATPSTSPTAFLPPRPEKRKSKDEPASPSNAGSDGSDTPTNATTTVANASGIPISATGGGLATQPQSLLNPLSGLNVQINTKKVKTASPCAISPVLLECPEQDCSKKYKHANGLRYHQSHAHGSSGSGGGGSCSMDEDSLQLPEEPPSTPSPVPAQISGSVTPNANIVSDAPSAIVPASPNVGIALTAATTNPLVQQQQQSTTVNQSSLPEVVPISLSSAATNIAVTTMATNTLGGSSILPTPQGTATVAPTLPPPPLLGSSSSQHQQPPQQPQQLQTAIQQQSTPTISQPIHTVAGGSITAGTSNQALSSLVAGSGTVTSAVGMPSLLSEQQQQTLLQQGPLKPGVLRFGPTPNDSSLPLTTMAALQQQQQQQNVPSQLANPLTGQSPLRPPTQMPGSTDIAMQQQQQQQSALSLYPGGPTVGNTQNLQTQGIPLSTKPSPAFSVNNNNSKQKKNRKSPGPGEYDSGNTREDVQSPAYSDISDDSTPVADQEIMDKSQPPKHVDLMISKKPQDLVGPPNLGGPGPPTLPLSSYGMYQFYQQQQYIVPPPPQQDQQNQNNNKSSMPPNMGASPLAMTPSQQAQPNNNSQTHHQQSQHLMDYANNKNKDPPLDLMTKPTPPPTSQQHQQQSQDSNKESNLPAQQPPPPVNLSNVGPPPGSGLPPGMSGLPGLGPAGLATPPSAKPLTHFYPFNYIPPGYPYNVEPNYGPVSIVSTDDAVKLAGLQGLTSGVQNQGSINIKDERNKESPSPHENSKMSSSHQQQLLTNKLIKSEPIKQEIKQESSNPGTTNSQSQHQHQQQQQQQPLPPQQPHAMHPKDLQALGGYPSIYQRHPMSLAAQQHLNREEELRRYYILSDQQRRQAAAAAAAQAAQNASQQPSNLSAKDDVGGNNNTPTSQAISMAQHQHQQQQAALHHHHHHQQQLQQQAQQHQAQQHQAQQHQAQQHQAQQQAQQQQQQQAQQHQKSNKSNSNSQTKATNLTKESPKSKSQQQEDNEPVKIKQEGQKPTMETQGPPPPPTSQYFLHPSYIAPAPYGFDPNHPMYRNVLMSAANPYNTSPYHLPLPRPYHAPEDLSRQTGTKALDALHHAAQYYTTHKIHELSERALKSPTSGGNGPGGPGSTKVSNVSSPNVSVGGPPPVGSVGPSGPNSLSTGGPSGPGGLMPPSSQSGVGSGPLNLQPPPNSLGAVSVSGTGKQDVGGLSSKSHGGPGTPTNLSSNDSHKQNLGGSGGPTSGTNNGGSNAPGGAPTSGSGSDSRSPPPQRHVHTHHHTHVGLGYPMYPAPYGAAVLTSQQAAAVTVINPFPPGPTK